MILARNSITLHHLRDITTVVWYYKLQASTASPPAKPTTETPSGWTTTEPSYTEGSTNSLYVVQKTTFSDGTFEYSDVSLSTSYEAAKAAYNKSVQAQTTANAAQESIDNLEIGGRNLLLNTNNFDSHKHQNSSGGGTWTFSGDEATYTATAKSWARLDLSYNPDMPSADISSQPNMDLLGDTTITLSIEAKCEGECNGSLYLQQIIYGNNNNRKYYPLTNPTADCKNAFVLTENWQRYSVTLPADYTNTTYWTSDSTQLSYPNTGFGALIYWNSTGTIHVRKPKLERGQKATDWTLAPEDTQADIDALQPELIVGTHGTTATATWTGTSTVLTEIKAGTRIQYKLSSAGASNVTLNLTLKNGTTTGAKNVYFLNTTRLGTQYGVNAIVDLIYDGSAWRVLNPYYNSNTVGTYGGTVTAGANGVKNYSLVMRDTETTWVSLTTTAGTGTSKSRYTGKLYPDNVMYMGSNNAYASGATTGTCYEALGVNLQYSTNCGSTLTSGKAVYLVGTLDSDGLFTLDATWWTQTIPTTADGKTYIYLGLAYSTTNIYLVSENTLYQYFEGAFRTLREIEEMKAAKVADNYLSADNTGIMVADMTDGTQYTPSNVPSGTKNTFIDEESFQVRDGQETLASFGETSQIGKDGAAHMEMDDESITFVSQNGTDTATMGAMSSTVKSVSESYTTDSDSLTITLSSDVTQGGTITLTVNNSAYTITYGTPYSYTGSSYSIAYTGELNILITNTGGITLNATVAYTTTMPASYGIAVVSDDDAGRVRVTSRHNNVDVANGALLTTTGGSFGLFDYKNSKWLIRTDSEGNVYLPIKAIKPKTIFNHKVVSFMNDAWNYVSVSQLADYNVVLVRAECYEVRQLLVFCRLFQDNPMYITDFAGSTRVRGGFIVDWTNNRVGVRNVGGGAYSANIYFQQVYGIL